jgi:hypothetical protein
MLSDYWECSKDNRYIYLMGKYWTALGSGQDGRCLPMMVKSQKKMIQSITGHQGKANAKLVLAGNVVYLISLVKIFPNTKKLYFYGTIYRDYI